VAGRVARLVPPMERGWLAPVRDGRGRKGWSSFLFFLLRLHLFSFRFLRMFHPPVRLGSPLALEKEASSMAPRRGRGQSGHRHSPHSAADFPVRLLVLAETTPQCTAPKAFPPRLPDLVAAEWTMAGKRGGSPKEANACPTPSKAGSAPLRIPRLIYYFPKIR